MRSIKQKLEDRDIQQQVETDKLKQQLEEANQALLWIDELYRSKVSPCPFFVANYLNKWGIYIENK